MNRFKFWGTLSAFSLLLLFGLPTVTSAQYRNDDDYYRNNRRNDTYDRRGLENTIIRVKDNSKSFRRTLDHALDNSRYDGRRREDRVLGLAADFARAADRLEDNYHDGRNWNRSADNARDLLQTGRELDNFLYSRGRQLDYSVQNQWSQISADLRRIADAYNLNFNGGYNNRRDRDDDYRRPNNGRWGRLPFPFPN